MTFAPTRRPVSLPPPAFSSSRPDDARHSRLGDLFMPPVREATSPGKRNISSETITGGGSSPGRSSNKERESLVKGATAQRRVSATGVFESDRSRRRSKDGWRAARSKKQRRCLFCGLALASLLLLGAIGGIAAGVLVSKHHKSDFIGGSGGGESTGKSGVGSASGGNPNSTAPATTGGEQAEQRGGKYGYDAFVVFGAS